MPFDRVSLFLGPLELMKNGAIRWPGQVCVLAAVLALSAGCSSRVELGGKNLGGLNKPLLMSAKMLCLKTRRFRI